MPKLPTPASVLPQESIIYQFDHFLPFLIPIYQFFTTFYHVNSFSLPNEFPIYQFVIKLIFNLPPLTAFLPFELIIYPLKLATVWIPQSTNSNCFSTLWTPHSTNFNHFLPYEFLFYRMNPWSTNFNYSSTVWINFLPYELIYKLYYVWINNQPILTVFPPD